MFQLLAICFTIKQIYDEITEYFSSKKHHKVDFMVLTSSLVEIYVI